LDRLHARPWERGTRFVERIPSTHAPISIASCTALFNGWPQAQIRETSCPTACSLPIPNSSSATPTRSRSRRPRALSRAERDSARRAATRCSRTRSGRNPPRDVVRGRVTAYLLGLRQARSRGPRHVRGLPLAALGRGRHAALAPLRDSPRPLPTLRRDRHERRISSTLRVPRSQPLLYAPLVNGIRKQAPA
jgi:hypothetical protein